MKLIDFGVREDEKQYIQEWSKDNDIEVKIVTDLLTPETVKMAQGYDGIVAYQQLPYDEKIFDTMNEYGIHVISLRNVGVDNDTTCRSICWGSGKTFIFAINNSVLNKC